MDSSDLSLQLRMMLPAAEALFAATLLLTPCAAGESWKQLAPLPDALGVAAPFAGVSGKVLLVGGGANFPDKMPWEGGKKRWHNRVWVLEEPGGTWKEAGLLPRPLAYGLSLSAKGTLLCLGGSDDTRHYADVFALEWKDGSLARNRTALASLPIPLANAAGAVDEDGTVYVACGSSEPGEQSASNRVFVSDYQSGMLAWRELPPLPAEPRILPVAAARGKAFYLFGGAALESVGGKVVRRNLRDAWCYTAPQGWQRLADLPKPCVAAPSPAPVVEGVGKGTDETRAFALLLAGDDGSRAGFQPVEQHPGFPDGMQRYDFKADRWELSGKVPAPRATAPCVKWGEAFVIPSGEVRPGVRSPEVWSLSINHSPEKSPP